MKKPMATRINRRAGVEVNTMRCRWRNKKLTEFDFVCVLVVPILIALAIYSNVWGFPW